MSLDIIICFRKQALATKSDAEKDGVKIPTTLQEYCVVSSHPRASESHMAMDDFYDDDYMDDDDEEEEDAIYEDDDDDSGNGESWWQFAGRPVRSVEVTDVIRLIIATNLPSSYILGAGDDEEEDGFEFHLDHTPPQLQMCHSG